jgi:hypothetical protein
VRCEIRDGGVDLVGVVEVAQIHIEALAADQ